jgi:hypothetical protein
MKIQKAKPETSMAEDREKEHVERLVSNSLKLSEVMED